LRRFARILACTDFSESGDRAVETAFGLVRNGPSTVMLAHVVDVLPVPNPMYAHYYPSDDWHPDAHAQAEAEARRALDALVPKQTGSRIPFEILVGHGQPVDEILRLAEENQADLIVVGTQGHSGLKHLLLGSVAERVVRHAACSVLLVR
jgi:nucleotide-binding universal stress UspA family protein